MATITLLFNNENGTMALKMFRSDPLRRGVDYFLKQYYDDKKYAIELKHGERMLNSLKDSDFNGMKDYDVITVTVTPM